MLKSYHIILVSLLLGFLNSANGQSTARSPYEGAIHSYNWSGLVQGDSYNFYLTASADGSGVYDDDMTAEFDFLDNTFGTVAADGKASVNVQWNNGAALHTYYFWIEVTGGSSGCSNYRYVEVTPQPNQFDLLSENVPVDNTISCPATGAGDGFNPEAGTYAAGYTTLQFRVSRENGTDNTLTADAGDTHNWSFVPVLAVDPDLGLDNVIITIEGVNSGVITPDANKRYTINGLDDEVLVHVSIENAPGYDLDVTLGVSDVKEDRTQLSDSNPANNTAKHTIQVMPLIDGMGGI